MVELGLGDLFANLWKLISHIKARISGLRLLSNCYVLVNLLSPPLGNIYLFIYFSVSIAFIILKRLQLGCLGGTVC